MKKINDFAGLVFPPQLWGGRFWGRRKSVAELHRVKRVPKHRDAEFFSASRCFGTPFLSAPQRYVFILTTLFFFATTNLFAQRTQLDSLIKITNAYNDNDNRKLELFNKISNLYQWFHVDTGVLYANHAIALAQELNNQKQLAVAYNNKAMHFFNLVKITEEEDLLKQSIKINKAINNADGLAENYLNLSLLKSGDERKKLNDDALALFTQTKNDDGIARVYLSLSYYYMSRDIKPSFEFFNKSIAAFTKINNRCGLANSYATLGNTFMYIAQYDSQLYYANMGLKIAMSEGNSLVISNAYTSIGNVYYMTSDYKNAIENYLTSLRIAESINNRSLQSGLVSNLGGLYYELKNYKKALEYLNKAKELAAGNKENLIFCYHTIAMISMEENQYAQAEENYKTAIKLALETKNTSRLCVAYFSLAELSILTGDYNKAFEYLEKAKETNPSEKATFGLVYLNNVKARAIKGATDAVLKKWGINPAHRNKIAIESFTNAVNNYKESGDLYLVNEACSLLSKTYEEVGNTDSAMHYYKMYSETRDSLLSTNNMNAVINLQLQYDNEKQEQQIASLQKDKALHQSEIKKQKTQRNILIAGCTLVLVFIGFIVNAYISKTKSNKEIEKTLEHLQTTQQQLVQQGKLAALGKMTSDVAHRIKDPIGKIKTLSPQGEQLVKQYENLSEETEKNFILQQLKTNLIEINNNGVTANEIVKDVLAQTRKQSA